MASPRVVARIESEELPMHLAVLIGSDNAQATVKENLLVR